MKAVFIVYGQSLTEPVAHLLQKMNIRGFTRWEEVHGRGSDKGEPHFGSHAWPSKNGSVLTVTDDQKAEALVGALRQLNRQTEQQGLRAFVWDAALGV